MTKKTDFGVFVALWNRMQDMTTPALHVRMADWLQKSWETKRTRLLLQAFRSSGKSTITGLFAAWLLYRRPDTRILVLAADLMLARKMVRNVKRIIERHPLTSHLKPDRADQWGADRFTVKRKLELRDPSMLAKGIGANVTGSRADIIICDDVEVPNTCDTAEKRADLRERLGEVNYVLVPGGTQLFIGTPHTWYTIYAETPRREIGEDRPFLDGFERLKLPVLDEGGVPLWPERYTPEEIEYIRRSTGPNKFSSQMMLVPVNIAEGRLDPAAFRRYEAPLDYMKAIGLLTIGDRKMVSASAWWDPAFGAKGGDASVLAVVYTDETGCYWLHKVAYLNGPSPSLSLKGEGNVASPQSGVGEGGEELDEATHQCRQVARISKELYVPSVAIETNGIGKFLPSILRRELARGHVPCAVREMNSTRPKDIRIMEAFDTVLAARMLHVHAAVYDTPFISEVQEWRPSGRNTRDDGLDAVAGALSLEPVRLKRFYASGRQNWHGASHTHEAKTDFEV